MSRIIPIIKPTVNVDFNHPGDRLGHIALLWLQIFKKKKKIDNTQSELKNNF